MHNKCRPMPSAETLLKYYSYDPDTGVFIKLKREHNLCSDTVNQPVTTHDDLGYIRLSIPSCEMPEGGTTNTSYLLAHRVAYKIMTGEDPLTINHINGNKDDNRWENLESVTHHENMLKYRGIIGSTFNIYKADTGEMIVEHVDDLTEFCEENNVSYRALYISTHPSYIKKGFVASMPRGSTDKSHKIYARRVQKPTKETN